MSNDDLAQTHMRQLEIFDPRDYEGNEVIVIGAGCLGSWSVLNLAKLGIQNIRVYDHDEIEEHNVSNQVYDLNSVGESKVDALKETIAQIADVEIEGVKEKIEESTDLDFGTRSVVVNTVDNMKARKEVFEKIKRRGAMQLIDARMAGEVTRIYSIDPNSPDDIEFYEENLYDDEDAAEVGCMAQSVVYNASFVGAMVANSVKKVLLQEDNFDEVIYDFATGHFERN